MLKKTYALLLSIVLILTLTACAKEETQTENKNTVPSQITVSDTASDNKRSDEKSDSEQTETVSSEMNDSSSAESKPIAESVQTKTHNESSTTDTAKTQAVIKDEPKKQTTGVQKTEKIETDTTEEEYSPPTVESEPVVQVERAKAEDVERLVVQYVNQYRNAQGDTTATVLNGLTEVARYRANQLITNFAHINIRTVCAELKYGTYYDMTQYGMTESDSYYEGYDREAIAKGNWGGTADEIAQRVATGFKNSTKHWDYVGDSKYGYMAVGATYSEATNMWYVCICMSSINYGG